MEPEVVTEIEVAEKCGGDMHDATYRPFAGAVSFADYDSFFEAQQAEMQVHEQTALFGGIVSNILADEELSLSSKLALVQQAVRDMGPRMTEAEKSASLFDKVKGLVSSAAAGFRIGGIMPSNVLEKPLGAFVVTKDVRGDRRWVALVSNKFEDRDGEIFEEKAHEEFVDWVNATKKYPELWVWHTPGSRIGVADFLAYTDGFLLESGVFDKGMEDVADRLADMNDRGVSHGFMYRPEDKAKRVYSWYRSFETSVLPHKRAANIWTAFADIKEGAMLSTEQRTDMVGILGEERVKALEVGLPALKEKLEADGIAWKSVNEMVNEAEPPKDPPKGGDGGDGGAGANGGDGGDGGAGAEGAPDPNGGGEGEKPAPGDGSPDPGKPAEGAPAGDGEQGVLANAISQFRELLAPLTQGISGLGSRLDALEGTVKELQETDEAKIAAAIAPKRPDPSKEGERPSESKETVLSPKLAAQLAALAGAADEKAVEEKPTDPYYNMAFGGGNNA